MSAYGLFIKDIEVDIRILEDLTVDVNNYKEIYETDTKDQDTIAMHRENLEFAAEQYHSHRNYLHNRMEEWMKLTLENDEIPVSLYFFRILKELRAQNKLLS